MDSAFHSYRADARGYVYFFIDRPDSEERTLVKADQIALEVYWRAPDLTKQRIVGLRDEKLLPTNIRYHLDHLTVVQDEFGDVIRLGDGDEVSDVVHPVSPGSESVYDFRLSDSLTISFPGSGTEPVRVYEVQVRPRDFSGPGFLGTLFLDRSTGAIVRMNFTFTPASYVDPYLDYIRISLDNALWEGRYWLPYRQEAELRRELPQLDFLAGSVIRGRFEIGGYELNAPIPDAIFRTPRVTAAPEAERRTFPFDRPLFAHLEEEGLDPPPSLEEIRRQAREMAAGRYLSGLSPLRLYFPSTSHAFRYNRAEGLFLGAGATLRPSADLRVHVHAGYGFSSGQPSGVVGLTTAGPGTAAAFAYANELRDLGPFPGADGVVNTLAALAAGSDYLDPYFATGLRVSLPSWSGPAEVAGTLTFERHRSASLAVDAEEGRFRPVRPVADGDLLAADLGVEGRPRGGDLRLGGNGRVGAFGDDVYGVLRLDATWSREATWRDLDVGAAAHAGLATDDAPPQELFLLGGRETLLGHPYRELVGDRFWLARGVASHALVQPWVNARVFAAVGWTELAGRNLPEGWAGTGDARVKASAGVGLGLAWDVLHLDLGRGLNGGHWAFAFSAARRFRGWL